ncbi:NAD(P)-binding domain-containing protein [Candidatus Micrarchaeota archaeon]|nr:NAD(P)-binding domain-containing protein [Candidatus Micrarchaeota archaeon]
MTKLFAVAGKPIAHSISPQMHQAAFDAMGIDAIYFRMLAQDADDVFSAAKEMGIAGMSITAPLKQGIASKVDEKNEEVKLLRACNTLIFENKKSSGYNTDPQGVAGALIDAGAGIRGKKAVVLGAGGAAKAAILALTKQGAKVVCANRTLEKAKEAARIFGCEACSVNEGDLENALEGAAILVSCISAHERVVPKRMLKQGMVVLDANYSAQSALVADAKEAGCKIVDATSWVLFQGIDAFGKFTGKDAPLEAMRKAVLENRPDAKSRRRIALIGFMGSGKSTVGKILAKLCGLEFVETDGMIAQSAGKSIPEIFEQAGEASFREMEAEALKEAVQKENCVISCGGGIVLREENAQLLQKECFVVWLFASAKEAMERTKGDASRPLVNRQDKEEVAHRILEARLQIYARACHIMVNTGGKTAQEVASMIAMEIGVGKP